ncbi:MAG TPA: hypothetical protein VES19_01445 [Candidatus Limnocylindrales bacterium]|nr:hypothetical protein [Candidatus Limnocylindrales bacterium]
MRGCLFTLLLGAVVIGFLVVVGLPAIAAGVLTGALSAAGLVADDTTVTVGSDPPTDLLGLHADTVRVTASDASFRGLEIGALDVVLGDVSVLDRTAGAIDGELTDVTIRGSGREVTLDRITIGGTTEAITATTIVPNAEAEALIADAVEAQTGMRPGAVTLTAPDGLTVRTGGQTLKGRFAINGTGDLVVRGTSGAIDGMEVALVRGGEDLPIELTSVRVTQDGGLRLTGDLAIGILG